MPTAPMAPPLRIESHEPEGNDVAAVVRIALPASVSVSAGHVPVTLPIGPTSITSAPAGGGLLGSAPPLWLPVEVVGPGSAPVGGTPTVTLPSCEKPHADATFAVAAALAALLELPFPDAGVGEKPGEFSDPLHAAATPATATAAVHNMSLFIRITFFRGCFWPLWRRWHASRTIRLIRPQQPLRAAIDLVNGASYFA